MHNCTSVRGYTASIASGNPFSPSTQAIKMSFTPRFCNSVSTCSQNFAPSVCATHSPSTSFWPSRLTPSHVDRLVLDVALIPHLHHQRVQVHDRIQLLQRPPLPQFHFLDHRVGHVGDQRRRNFDPVHLFQVALDLAGRHPACVHR